MNRPIFLIVLIILAWLTASSTSGSAAEMTFQLVNNTDRPLNMKLFSRAESHQEWPSKTKAFSVRPDAAPQQLKITCEEGEQICWGAWVTVQKVSGEILGANGQRATRTSKFTAGAGERGLRTCEKCCHICKDGALVPIASLRDPSPAAR